MTFWVWKISLLPSTFPSIGRKIFVLKLKTFNTFGSFRADIHSCEPFDQILSIFLSLPDTEHDIEFGYFGLLFNDKFFKFGQFLKDFVILSWYEFLGDAIGENGNDNGG